ncbi:MAG: dihydroneopterin triphosphate 2'-epimerase [Gammaproteobacteria bacterium]|nr:dihydroneopterin triphosphate 2'-epimerase [Gammaproteobacteria bacterium]
MQTGIIRIINLRLRTYVGFNPEERAKQQDVVVNVEIHHRVDRAARVDDEVAAALDYKTVAKAIIGHVEGGRFLLLEKLVNDLLDICHGHPAVSRAIVTVDKPHALRFADSVSLTLAWDERDNPTWSECRHESHIRPLSHAS